LVTGNWLLVTGYWPSRSRESRATNLPAYKASGPAGPKALLRCSLQIWNLKCLFISACGRVVFAFWQTGRYFNRFSNKSQQESD